MEATGFDGAHGKQDDDAMCYTAQSTNDSGGIAKFDLGDEDRWDARADGVDVGDSTPTGRLVWWAVKLSEFICPPLTGGTTPNCAAPDTPVYS